jgi:transposase
MTPVARAAVATPAVTPPRPEPSFVPMIRPSPAPAPAPVAVPAQDIRIELHRNPMAVTVTWPSSAAAECATWMRELLR